jgi:hypothetical protein
MKCLLDDGKLIFIFGYSYVKCYNYDYNYYQINGILPFAVMDLAFKIIKATKKKIYYFKKEKTDHTFVKLH